MKNKNEKLVKTATKLYTLGIKVDVARNKLKALVAKGVPYESPEMIKALNEFQVLDKQWKQLEADYKRQRDKMLAI